MTLSERFAEIRTGFERPFWVANISELFERLSYYAAFASLARYLHETLNFGVERASSLTGLFGGLVCRSGRDDGGRGSLRVEDDRGAGNGRRDILEQLDPFAAEARL